MGRWILLILITASGLISCIDKDYTAFDESPAVTAATTKIRVLNINFNQSSVTVKIGGTTFKEGLVHRQLTAYQEASSILLGDSIIEIYNQEKKLLSRQKLNIDLGNNYTIVVAPAYHRKSVQYDGSKRWFIKTNNDSATVAIINDPVSPPIQGKTSARYVAFAIDQAQYYSFNNGPGTSSAAMRIIKYPWVNHELENNDDYNYYQLGPPSFELGLPSQPFPPSLDYDITKPPIYQVGSYKSFAPQIALINTEGMGLGRGYSVHMGSPPHLVSDPYSFVGGESYTIITNGSIGVLNDVSQLTNLSEDVTLEPIPYEEYVLPDSDHSQRLLEPLTQHPYESATTNLILQHMNVKYTRVVTLAIDKTLENKYFNVGQGDVNMITTPYSGVHSVDVLAVNTASPIFTDNQSDLTVGNYYMNYFYCTSSAENKVKTQKMDTAFVTGMLKFNIANFLYDLEPFKVINAVTGEVLIPSVGFEEISTFISVPVTVEKTSNGISKSVPLLQFLKASNDEFLFEVDLSPINSSGYRQLLIDPVASSDCTTLIYTLTFSGSYSEMNLMKSAVGIAKYTPKTSGDILQENYKTINIASIQ